MKYPYYVVINYFFISALADYLKQLKSYLHVDTAICCNIHRYLN